MANNTIFDDVFRTMVEKLPRLTLPLINEVFGTSYGPDTEILQMRNGIKMAAVQVSMSREVFRCRIAPEPEGNSAKMR